MSYSIWTKLDDHTDALILPAGVLIRTEGATTNSNAAVTFIPGGDNKKFIKKAAAAYEVKLEEYRQQADREVDEWMKYTEKVKKATLEKLKKGLS